jgi:hypothetical protein
MELRPLFVHPMSRRAAFKCLARGLMLTAGPPALGPSQVHAAWQDDVEDIMRSGVASAGATLDSLVRSVDVLVKSIKVYDWVHGVYRTVNPSTRRIEGTVVAEVIGPRGDDIGSHSNALELEPGELVEVKASTRVGGETGRGALFIFTRIDGKYTDFQIIGG